MSEIPFYPNEVDEAERLAALEAECRAELGHRVAYLESELERIRPVYEAACAWRDSPGDSRQGAEKLIEAVDTARSPR